MNKDKIPQSLQGILWSAGVASLDLEKDKVYIINQILSFGTLDHFQWLFANYSKKTILSVFLNNPTKIYTPSRFNFLTKIIFQPLNKNLNPKQYVANLPRDIR